MNKEIEAGFAADAAGSWEGPKTDRGDGLELGGFALQEVMEGEPVKRKYPPLEESIHEVDDPSDIYFRNDPNGLYAVGSEAYNEFLNTCLQENLNHLRHVENERITFLSLYLVGVAELLKVALDHGGLLAVVLMAMLLVLSFICYTLVKRWNKVFDGHNRIAKRLVAMVDSQGRMEEDPLMPQGWEKDPRFKTRRHHANYYYYFDNKAGEAAYAAWQEKHPQPEKKKKVRTYLHTGELFLAFTQIICLVEAVFFVVFLLRFFGIYL